jgi:hypothetical protein
MTKCGRASGAVAASWRESFALAYFLDLQLDSITLFGAPNATPWQLMNLAVVALIVVL